MSTHWIDRVGKQKLNDNEIYYRVCAGMMGSWYIGIPSPVGMVIIDNEKELDRLLSGETMEGAVGTTCFDEIKECQ